MERVIRLEVQLVLRLEPRPRNVVYARTERLRSHLFFFIPNSDTNQSTHTAARERKNGRRLGRTALRFGIARGGRA